MRSKVQILWDDVSNYKERSLWDNINDRLDQSLKLYLESIENSLDNLKCKNLKSMYKRLSK